MKRLLAVVALLLAGCGPTITEGEVIDREFVPEHMESYMRQQYIGQTCTTTRTGTSSYQSCTPNYMWVTDFRWVPDRWSIRIEQCLIEGNAAEEECHDRWLDVTGEVYDSVTEGQWYALPSPGN